MAKPKSSESQALAPIIIKKVIKKVHGGHHGGAWKVAYADFVTAMMAFFLLMWLLNATSQEQKQGISNYFDPIGVSQGSSGAGGVLGGKTISVDGVLKSDSAPPINSPPLGAPGESEGEASGNAISIEDKKEPSESSKAADAADEQKQFKQAESAIKQAIRENPELKDLLNNLLIEETPEGLRIQIVDQDKKSMFPVGSSAMFTYTKQLLEQVAKVIIHMPNKIAISGHTDSLQYAKRNSYTNWELSSDRANASRRELIIAGLSPTRIFSVSGKADIEHIDKKNPESPINRRISITLLKNAITKEH